MTEKAVDTTQVITERQADIVRDAITQARIKFIRSVRELRSVLIQRWDDVPPADIDAAILFWANNGSR